MWDEAAKGFLFDIGDVVQHKISADRWVVIARSLTQGQSNGIGWAYICTDGSDDNATEFFQTELEKPS